MLSVRLPTTPASGMSANSSTMQALGFSHRLVPFTRRLSPLPITGVSLRCSISVAPVTFKCSSLPRPSCVDEVKTFVEASKHGNLVPLYQCIFSDQLTPVLAYRCLVKEDDREAPSFLFESAEPNFQISTVGRYSVVGAQPIMEIVAKENKVTVMDHEFGHLTKEIVDDPMSIPRRISNGWKPYLTNELPDAFCGLQTWFCESGEAYEC